MPQPRFTHENTTGATTETINAMNEEFEALAGGIRSDNIRDQAAEMIVSDHGGKWSGDWKPVFGED